MLSIPLIIGVLPAERPARGVRLRLRLRVSYGNLVPRGARRASARDGGQGGPSL